MKSIYEIYLLLQCPCFVFPSNQVWWPVHEFSRWRMFENMMLKCEQIHQIYLLNYSQFRNTRKRLWFRVNDNRVNKYCISHFIHCFRYLTNYQLLATSSSCPNYPPPPPVITSLLPPHDVCEVMATCHWLLQNKPNKVKCDYKVLHKFYKPIWCDTKIDFHNSENAHSSNTLTCICLSVISYCQP